MGRIEWLPIDECRDELRDGRDVLLWVDDRATVGFWDTYIDRDEVETKDWATYEQTRPQPTHIAEMNDPE